MTAGDGGDGYNGETPGDGGSGGVGAEAAALSSSSSTVVAGSGGSGGSSSGIAQGGDGGDGGAALSVAGSIEAEDSTFAGGDGGNGGLSGTSTPSSGGNGGSVNSAGTQVSGGTAGSAGFQGATAVQDGTSVTVNVTGSEHSAEVHLVSGGVTRAFGIIENGPTSVTLRVPAGIYNLKVVSGELVRTQGCDVPSGGCTVSVDLPTDLPTGGKYISTEVEGSGDVVLVGGDLSAAVTGEELKDNQYTSFDVIMNVDAVDALDVPDVQFPVSYDITIEKTLYADSMFVGTKNVENLSSPISFVIGIDSVITVLQERFELTSDYGKYLVVYAQHDGRDPVPIYYELVEYGGSYYVKVTTGEFSTFSVGYSVCTLTIEYENDTSSPVSIEVLQGQTVDITSYIITPPGSVCRTSIDPSGTGGSVSFDETDGRYTYTAGTTSATLTISYLPQHKVTILQVCGNQESQHVIQVVEGEGVDITWYLTMSGYEASVSIYPSDTGGSIYGNIYYPGTTDATITITFTPIEVPPPPTVITAEAEDNLVTITVANPQSSREYAVRDGAGDLQTTWTSGTGTLTFGPLQPGDVYSVVGRNSIVLNESTEATFVIPEVPEIVVVSVSSDSVTLASDEDVRYLLTDSAGNRIGTWATGDGTDIVWEELLPEEAYYAQAEVGQGRVILTAGPVLVRPPMGGEVTGDIRHGEAYIYVEPYEGWEYSLDGGPWQSSERIVYGPLAPGTVTLLARNTEAGLTVERVVDVPIVPTRASYTDRTVTITTEEGKTYMLADVDGGSVRGPGGDIWIAGTGGDVTWEGLDPRTDYFVYIVTGEGIDAIVFGPETVKLAEEVVTVSGANDGNDLYITLDNLAAGREYAIASSDGTVLTPWADGSEGTAGYGPIAFGASYTVLGRSVDGTGGTIVETTFEIPALPDYDSAEYSGEVLAMLTDPMWSYQLVDSSGGPVAVSGGIWIAGTGGDVVWEGLTGGMDHFMYARMNLAGFDVELGPVLVAEAVFATPGELDIPDSSQRSESVSVRSEEGVSYMLTDSEGNIVPGPGGQIWVRGTGDVMEWAVPDADDDYDITIRSADADTGAVTESGPHPVPRAEDPEEQPLYSLATVGLLAAYTLFLRLVHREGPFDRRTWAVTAAMLAAAAATGLLYSGIWWQAGMTVTAAATFLSWLYCSDAVASKPKGGS